VGPRNGLDVFKQKDISYPFECASLLMYALRTDRTREDVCTYIVRCFMSEAVFLTLLVALYVSENCVLPTKCICLF
jgi:hypothetical protein